MVEVRGVGRVPLTAADVAIAAGVDGAGDGVAIVDGATCDSSGVTRRASAVLDGAGAGAGAGTSGVDVDIALIVVGIVFVREEFSSSILILVPVAIDSINSGTFECSLLVAT